MRATHALPRSAGAAEESEKPSALLSRERNSVGIVADFLGRDGAGEGQSLQRALLAVDLQAPHGYLHDLWQARYLSMRDPLPVTQNVAGGFALPDAAASLPLAHKAGLVAFTTALFLHDALSGRLAQDRQSGRPLCMLQYAMLAGTNRIPQPLTDRVQAGAGLGHCIVAWRGAFFPLPDWVRRQGPAPPRELLDRLHRELLHYSGGRLNDDIAALAVRSSGVPDRE